MVNQRSRELRMCALLLTVSILALPSFAAGKRWSSKGQPGPGVTALVMSRSNPSLLYVGAYGGGVFRSLDAAESWQAINAGITDFRIVSLAMDPVVPLTLYAGTDSGQLFSTIDGGENWKKMPAFTDQRIGAIVVAAEGRPIYVLTHGSIFRSSDGGENWTATRNGLDGNVEALSTATSVPSKLFAGTATGLFTTSDRGDSWSRVPIPGVGQVGGVAVSDDGQTIYVNSGDFHTSTDGGRTWNSVPGNGVRSSNAMAIDRSSSSTAWATTYDRGGRTHSVYRTTDRGTTWQRLDFVDDVRSLLLDGDTVYAGTSSGVYKTIDATGGWTLRNSGLNAGASEVVVDAANPKLMYAATAGGIFKTTDGGNAWAPFADLDGAQAVAIDPSNPSVVYASSIASARKTTDGGATWSEIHPNPAKLSGARALAIDPSHPSTVYAVLAAADGLSKSTDGGSTFSLINAGLPYDFYYGFASTALAIDPSAPSNLFASTYEVARSTNGGASWEPVTTGFPIYYATALAVDPSQSAFVYAATGQGLFRSSDGGSGWERLENGLPTSWFMDVVVDPWKSENVYVASGDSGVFKSSDRGKNWTAFNDGLPVIQVFGLPVIQVYSLAIDSTGTFLAAATTGGVFTFSSSEDVITLPPELHAKRLDSDPQRLARLLEQVRALSRGSPPTSQDSKVGLVFAAAANAAGALGTYFRSDVTLMNDRATPQDVIAVWLAEGSDGTDAPSLRLTLAPSAITVTNFVGKMGLSGVGSLLFIGIDANANLDTAASLTGFSRIWTAGPDGRGSVSQSLPAAHIASLGGNSAAAAIGLRMDSDFRTNVGIVNLDTTSHTFLLTLTGERKSAALSVSVEPFSMRQVPLPEGDYGALTARFEVTSGEFPWTAYGSSVDNLTGDGWASQAVQARVEAATATISGRVMRE
jgi:photosystem II stability/assembly factor-like uncharacterized protein